MEAPNELGLGFVQISVTAATPMVEDAQKSFLDDTIQEEDEDVDDDSPKNERKRTAELEKGVADAVDEILEEARVETSKRPSQPPPLPPPKKVASPPMDDDDDLPPPPPPEDGDKFEASFEEHFEANFEANFDDAFGNEAHPPIVGGRASIPEELEPDQLVRLQNLKESNA